MRNQFSHITIENKVGHDRLKTLCGSWVLGYNLPAIYWEGAKYARPLCPKCAAARLIQEVSGGIDNPQQS